MKKVLQIILFFAFLNIYAQEIKEYRILSVVDSMPIENAYITADNWLKTITDKKGFFKLSGDYQNIQISHLAFKAKIVKYKTMVINKITYLEADEKVLNEVIITNKKKIIAKKTIAIICQFFLIFSINLKNFIIYLNPIKILY